MSFQSREPCLLPNSVKKERSAGKGEEESEAARLLCVTSDLLSSPLFACFSFLLSFYSPLWLTPGFWPVHILSQRFKSSFQFRQTRANYQDCRQIREKSSFLTITTSCTTNLQKQEKPRFIDQITSFQ